MYAHQVIDDLFSKENQKICSDKTRRDVSNKIRNAQHFDIGFVGETWIDSLQKTGAFADIFSFPPYNVFTLSFYSIGNVNVPTPQKCCHMVLFEKNEENVDLYYFCKHREWDFNSFLIHYWMTSYCLQTDQVVVHKPLGETAIDSESDVYLRQATLHTILTVKAFLNCLSCRNITTIDHEPPSKLNKSRIKKGKQPLFTYKTLVIKPTSKRQHALEAQGLWENRIHLCRGHFKEYTEDKPLFGKLTGRYWWQPSVRGRKEKGVVLKDYEMRPEDFKEAA